jgi:ABC-type multidrug transport system fused ATPase/permease subunit
VHLSWCGLSFVLRDDSKTIQLFGLLLILRLRLLFRALGGSPLHYVGFTLCMLIVAFVEVVSVGSIPIFTAILAEPVKMQGYLTKIAPGISAMISSQQVFIYVSCISIIVFFLTKNVALSLIGWAQARFIAVRQSDLAIRLLSEFMSRPYIFHLQRDSAALQRIVTTDAFALFSGTVIPATQLITETLIVTLVAVMLVYVNFQAAIAAVLILGGFVLIFYRLFRSRIGDLGGAQQRAGAEMVKWISQALGGVKEVKLLGREDFFVNAFARHVRDYAHDEAYSGMVAQFPRYLIETVVVICMSGAVILMNLRDVALGQILSTLALFGVAAVRLIPSVNRILAALTSMRFHRPAAKAVFDTLPQLVEPSAVKDSPRSATVKVLPFSNVVVENVRYSYSATDMPALDNVSFTVPRGMMVGIAGASGAGKSTLVDIMLGLHRPTTGTVKLDDGDIFSILPVWQRMIGYVPQSIFIINDTIRRNIAFGIESEAIDDDRVWRALRQAQLEEFVKSLPEGLYTSLGEAGSRLSGGQLQRIGIARALYGDPAILVMDEATSALDNQTENELGSMISATVGAKTILVVAHRLNTIKRCDKLIYLDGGRLAGEGHFDELYARDERFRKLMGEMH